jgi:hypothetical protein
LDEDNPAGKLFFAAFKKHEDVPNAYFWVRELAPDYMMMSCIANGTKDEWLARIAPAIKEIVASVVADIQYNEEESLDANIQNIARQIGAIPNRVRLEYAFNKPNNARYSDSLEYCQGNLVRDMLPFRSIRKSNWKKKVLFPFQGAMRALLNEWNARMQFPFDFDKY